MVGVRTSCLYTAWVALMDLYSPSQRGQLLRPITVHVLCVASTVIMLDLSLLVRLVVEDSKLQFAIEESS